MVATDTNNSDTAAKPAAENPLKTDGSVAEAPPASKGTVSSTVPLEKPKEEEKPRSEHELGIKWRGTLGWSIFVCLWYFLLQTSLRHIVAPDPSAQRELFQQVPVSVYIFSEAAFFCATILNLISLIFEDTPEKKQLALLSAVIKGISCHCDYLIITGQAVVAYDAHGALFLPSRYVQWSCSTPTMIFTLSRISDLTPLEIAATLLSDWLMVVTGYMAAALPWSIAWLPLLVCFVCFAYVLYMLRRMIYSALSEASSFHAQACLWFTLGSTMVIWNLFWVAWVIARLPWAALHVWGEPLTIFCNFAAKVVFSSSIMYNNYVTIAQRRHRAQVEREHRERIQAVAELSTAVARKDEFIAVVGHELRTPLNAIIQLSHALARGAGGQMMERGKSWLETISSSASHLLAIVNDILLMQAARASSITLRQEVVDLGGVIDSVLRTITPMTRKGVVMEKVVHEKLPPVVGDRRRLVQVLSNLVGNAAKFTDKGKISVKAYPDRGARHVMVKVVDTGCGIPKDKLHVIFQAFQQGDMGKTRKHGGVGLGLSIAKELVHSHGGLISVHSEGAGAGTSVVLKLPVLQLETDEQLETEFRSAYEALGYHTDELLAPEIATAEKRACPAFLPRERPEHMYGYTRGPSGMFSTFNSGPILTGRFTPYSQSVANSARFNAADLPGSERPSGLMAAHLREGLGVKEGGGSGGSSLDPRMSFQSGIMTPTQKSRLMSMDMQHAVVQHYRWSGESTASQPAGGLVLDGDNNMFSTHNNLTAFGSMAPNVELDGAHGEEGGNREAGVPGFAVALMSSLYAPPDEATAAQASNPAGAQNAKGVAVASVPGALPLGSNEDEDEAVAGAPAKHTLPARTSGDRDSSNSSLLPGQVPVAGGGGRQRRKSGLSIASTTLTSSLHPAYNENWDKASEVVQAAMEANYVVRASEDANAMANATVKAAASKLKPMEETEGEWDSYCKTAGTGVANRSDAPVVQANQARLSAQYEQAAAEAAAKNLPLDPQWHSWVSRIPEHHRE
uniref:histidine kinase n=1 Tax=Chlamydomonas leiostraca TaxID=1034604 RepID=A0A7S0RFF1_9CHLO|mmetsp:Transcript_21258/g.54037  ORF Transcript_21258/g.54037 Transcript_21258/m.54037 type:complete len:1020 (+) Transcript_21258:92-3151(+)